MMRAAAVLVGLVSWGSSAAAGPGMVVASRAEVFSAPSDAASVVSELGHGAEVCVLDETNYGGVLHRRPGWLAIRLPGGVGYVPVETIDTTALTTEVQQCGTSASAVATDATTDATTDAATTTPAPTPEPAALPRVAAARRSGPLPPSMRYGEPAPPVTRPPLLAGRFLPLRAVRFVLGLGSGVAWLHKEAAANQKIDDSGLTINGTLGFTIRDIFMVSSAFSVAFPSDHASFSEEVVPEVGGGSPESADSSLSVVSYSIAAGLRTPFLAFGLTENGWVAGSLFAQYGSAGVSGNRSIANCTDCRKDEINIAGGTFWQVGFDLLVPSRQPVASYGLTIVYQHFAADAGLSDEVRVGFSCWLQ
jgi:hypothetical protein